MKTRRELKEEYKQIKYKMGVFQIKNNINGKIFIGNSLDLKAIWHSQRLQLETDTHINSDLQNDWNESSSENFTYEVLEELEETTDDKPIDYKKEVRVLQEMIIEELQPFDDRGYNRRPKKV